MNVASRILHIRNFVDRHLGKIILTALLLVVRIAWGYSFFLSGKGKLGRLDQVTEFFASLHIPMPHLNAVFVANLECIGGLLLLAGVLARPVALLLTGNMIVAYITADPQVFKPLFTEGNPGPLMNADPFWFLVASVTILALGPGKLSIDAILKWSLGKFAHARTPRLVATPALATA